MIAVSVNPSTVEVVFVQGGFEVVLALRTAEVEKVDGSGVASAGGGVGRADLLAGSAGSGETSLESGAGRNGRTEGG